MLRYIERIGLVVPARSPGGYRLYGAAELQRLRTLRELLRDHDVALGEVGFARRLRIDDDLAGAVSAWLDATGAPPPPPPPRRLDLSGFLSGFVDARRGTRGSETQGRASRSTGLAGDFVDSIPAASVGLVERNMDLHPC
jgi:hypothetical protein